jgi:hypothetical protein
VYWSGYDTTALDIEVDPQRRRFGSRKSDFALQALVCVCVYYCRTYYKAVYMWGGGIWEDMCYERRRAEACVD